MGERELVKSITDNLTTGAISSARLATDDRILARITDGIYRQPASALRELIANAYDADATNVFITTDVPRFTQISIRDDGNGLTIESLARLIHHIGGSPKRTLEGAEIGVTNKRDPSLSPKGRRMIGKIGIGLFSVSQLTRHFQIITKVRGNEYRLVAEVTLKTYTEDDLASIPANERKSIETGTVNIRAVRAADKASHGTEIILLHLRPQTRDLLQSRDMWLGMEAGADFDLSSEGRTIPAYHIGQFKPSSQEIETPECVPWDKTDPPEQRFGKLFQAVIDQVETGESNPKLETVLDNYLRTLWTLSLSAPVDYIEKHPFDLTVEDDPERFVLSNESKGQASELQLNKGQAIRDKLQLRAPERGAKNPFSVFFDGIQLLRPLRFNKLPTTSQAVTRPLLFVGKCEPNLSKIAKDERGGDLAFEAYFLWTPKVVPKEHNGLLVRIADASGTLFDETFAKYQIAELTRLRQITAEVFVLKGLDAALNIDRESFNYAHPHYQYIMKWVHRALRQLTNMHKQIASVKRAERNRDAQAEQTTELSNTVKKELAEARGGRPAEPPPNVVFSDPEDTKAKSRRKKGDLVFDKGVVFSSVPEPQRVTTGKKHHRGLLESKIAAVAQLLEAYGVFENMPYAKQQRLLKAIVAIFTAGDKGN